MTDMEAERSLIAQAKTEEVAKMDKCNWVEDEDGTWHTDCGGQFVFEELGTPMLNDMLFCCYCGKPLEQVDFEYPEDEDDATE